MERKTRQRALLLECLREAEEEHITASYLMEQLMEKGTPVGKSTVYRFLDALEREGIICKYLVSKNEPACYQLVGGKVPHYHMLCEFCGTLVHFENKELEHLLEILGNGDFLIEGDKSVFYGHCKECLKK